MRVNPENQKKPSIPLKDIAKSFSDAALTYDTAAILQNEVGQRLMERLDYVKINPERIIDLGCGTGNFINSLQKRYKKSEVIGLDIAHGMLKQAKNKHDSFFKKTMICGADASRLPFANESCDLIFSNFAIQWCTDLNKLFFELNRVLKPGGLVMFTTFGPDTLCELKQAWRAVDDTIHVNEFTDMHDVGDALVYSQFADPVMDCERITMTYEKVITLMKDLKAIGAHNIHPNRSKHLTSRGKLTKLEQAYETFRRDDQTLPATYEVVYGHAWATEIKQIPLAAGQVAIPIEKIGGLKKKR